MATGSYHCPVCGIGFETSILVGQMSSAPMGIHCLMMSIRVKMLQLVIALYAKKGSVSILF